MTLTPRETLVLREIEKAADEGRVCPSNIELAKLMLVSSIATPSETLSRLERRGVITVERARNSRVITITATGKATAIPVDKKHAEQATSAARRRNQLAEMIAEGMSFEEARQKLKVSQTRVSQMWRAICNGLGWQAV